MRSPLSSRTNSRPERVTTDEFFDLVAWTTVMIFPSVSQLRLDAVRRIAGTGNFLGSTHVPFSVFWSAGRRANVRSGGSRREAVRRPRCQRRYPFFSSCCGGPQFECMRRGPPLKPSKSRQIVAKRRGSAYGGHRL